MILLIVVLMHISVDIHDAFVYSPYGSAGGAGHYGNHHGGQYHEVCIRYIDVNRAVNQAKHRRGTHGIHDLDSLEPPLPSIAESGELMLEVTKILTHQ